MKKTMDLELRYSALSAKSSISNASGMLLSNVVGKTSPPLHPSFPDHQFFPVNKFGRGPQLSTSPKGTKRKWSNVTGQFRPRRCLEDSSGLALGLGPTSSSSDSRVSSGSSSSGASCKDNNTEDESSMDLELGIQLQLGSTRNASPKKASAADTLAKPIDADSEFRLQLSLAGASNADPEKSCVLSAFDCGLALGQTHRMQVEEPVINMNNIPVVDEGSTSARWKPGGYIPSLLMAPTLEKPLERHPKQSTAFPTRSSYPAKAARTGNNPNRNATPGTEKQRTSGSTKTCQFRGCGKGARGASGLCIAHGGGRRCQKDGCNKGAEGRTVFCKAHGGGRRCQQLGCTKSAEGRTDYCIGHGGGRRCSHQGCQRAARGKSGLCIRHGGGKRCQREGCTKSAEGYSGLCISHGGGRRCQFPDCTKGAQGSTMFCKAHGGGKRCMVTGCNKGAEGSTPLCKGHGGGKRCMYDGGGICPKSVHGGTKFCVAHGGGKRCAVQGCTKSARGRTDFCVRHGGGKRCKFENCGKSAQGSTDFCKAHGGGKRCQWGAEGTPYENKVVQGKNGEVIKGPCDRFARGKTGLCAAHSALVQDWRVHGEGTLGPGIGPGLFHGLASSSKSQGSSAHSASASASVPTVSQSGSSAPLNTVHGSLNDVEMADAREKGSKDPNEGKTLAASSFDSVEMGGTKSIVGNKSLAPYWPALPRAYIGPFGRPVVGHSVGQQIPVVNLHPDLVPVATHVGVCKVSAAMIPPQVLVPASMKSTDVNSLPSLPEGRVHGGTLMAFLSKGGPGIVGLGQSSNGKEHLSQGHGPWM